MGQTGLDFDLGSVYAGRPNQGRNRRMVERIKTVFNEHKTEMLIAAGAGFLVGAIFF